MATPARKLVEEYTVQDMREFLRRIRADIPQPAGQGADRGAGSKINLDFSNANVTGLPGLSLPASFGAVLDNNSAVSILPLAVGQVPLGVTVGSLPIASNFTANGILVPSSNGGISSLVPGGNSLVPISAAGAPVAWASLTGGTGISVSGGANSITITNSSPGAPAGVSGNTLVLPYGVQTNSSGIALAANTVFLALCFVPTPMTVNVMAFGTNLTVASSHAGVGLYTYASGQASASLLGQFTASTASSTGIHSGAPSGGAFALAVGWYWFAWTVDTASNIAFEGFGTSNLGLLSTPIAGNRILANATNTSAAGVLPATTGTILAPTSLFIPMMTVGQ